jgi:hypothetical protein
VLTRLAHAAAGHCRLKNLPFFYILCSVYGLLLLMLLLL